MTVRSVAETISFEGEDYTLVFDWEVIADFEETWGHSVADVLNPPRGGSPMMSRLVKLFLAGLRRHHPEADLNLAGAMMTTPGVTEVFYGAVGKAMPQPGDSADDEGNAPAANRKARRAAKSQSRSAGRTG